MSITDFAANAVVSIVIGFEWRSSSVDRGKWDSE